MGFFEGRNVLITGAAGFGGSNLTKLLINQGANITALVRDAKKMVNLEGYLDKVKVVEADVRDEKAVMGAVRNQDIIYHFATFLGTGMKSVMSAAKDPKTTFGINVIGAVNVARNASLENVKRMVFISTCHVYGEQPSHLLPLKEDVVPNPLDMYAVSKYTAELALRHFMDDIEIIITRAFNQYGEGHIGDYFMPKVITHFLRGVKPVLWSPYTTRDYSYVGDVVEGYSLVGEKGRKSEVYHFSSERETSMGDMLKAIANSFEVEAIDVEWRSDRPNDFSRSSGDSTKARNQLGWLPRVSIEEGMNKTIDWWKRHPELWDLK